MPNPLARDLLRKLLAFDPQVSHVHEPHGFKRKAAQQPWLCELFCLGVLLGVPSSIKVINYTSVHTCLGLYIM